MRQISVERFNELLETQQAPCISLYQPTHRQNPENEQDPIVYRNLLAEMEESLREAYPVREVREIMEKFQTLSRDQSFWNHRTPGLAIFCSPTRFEIFELQRPVKKLLVVADSFHTKPLIRILQSADRYQVLGLSRSEIRLYEGNRDELEPVEMPNVRSDASAKVVDDRSLPTQPVGTYGKRSGVGGTAIHHGHGSLDDIKDNDAVKFFRAVDEDILEHHSRPSNLPMVLAALADTQAIFREISGNPFLLPEGINADPESLDVDELRKRAWEKIEPAYVKRLTQLKDNFHIALSRQSGSGDLSDVAKAAVADQVATLLVEADRIIPGVLDRTTGAIRDPDSATAHVDDMLDDLAELVLARGGEVVIVPKDRMPTDSGLAAIYRY